MGGRLPHGISLVIAITAGASILFFFFYILFYIIFIYFMEGAAGGRSVRLIPLLTDLLGGPHASSGMARDSTLLIGPIDKAYMTSD